MTAIKDFVENIENEIPGLDSHHSSTDAFLHLMQLLNSCHKDENKIQIRELLHELEEMTCELEQIQMKDLVDILRSDMDSLVERLSTSVGVLILVNWDAW